MVPEGELRDKHFLPEKSFLYSLALFYRIYCGRCLRAFSLHIVAFFGAHFLSYIVALFWRAFLITYSGILLARISSSHIVALFWRVFFITFTLAHLSLHLLWHCVGALFHHIYCGIVLARIFIFTSPVASAFYRNLFV